MDGAEEDAPRSKMSARTKGRWRVLAVLGIPQLAGRRERFAKRSSHLRRAKTIGIAHERRCNSPVGLPAALARPCVWLPSAHLPVATSAEVGTGARYRDGPTLVAACATVLEGRDAFGPPLFGRPLCKLGVLWDQRRPSTYRL